jgi:hypothetical protein
MGGLEDVQLEEKAGWSVFKYKNVQIGCCAALGMVGGCIVHVRMGELVGVQLSE